MLAKKYPKIHYEIFHQLNIPITRLENEQRDVGDELRLHQKECACKVEFQFCNDDITYKIFYIKKGLHCLSITLLKNTVLGKVFLGCRTLDVDKTRL